MTWNSIEIQSEAWGFDVRTIVKDVLQIGLVIEIAKVRSAPTFGSGAVLFVATSEILRERFGFEEQYEPE